MPPMTDKMIAEKDGVIGWMIFNNPERRNAIGLEMWEAIPAILDDFEGDDEIRVIALTGSGDKAFISGADISQFEKKRASPEAIADYDRIAERATARLYNSPKPTIAMIHGYCVGGGVGVALNCDLRISADHSRFAVPPARLGLGYRASGIKQLMDFVGPASAKEILFTARQFSAEEAWHMGLINRVVPAAELEATVREICATIAENAPLTIRAVKGTVAEIAKAGAAYDREACAKLVEVCFTSEDYAEGRRAFAEKRKPVFRGR